MEENRKRRMRNKAMMIPSAGKLPVTSLSGYVIVPLLACN